MSSFFVLDNVACPALPLHGGHDGHPDKFVFFEDLTSTGVSPTESVKGKYTGANCCRVPADNGDSWTVADANDAARGAFVYIEVVGEVNMVEVVNRLLATKANQARVLSPAESAAQPGPPAEEAPAPVESNQPLWQQLGFASKAAWKEAGSPQS